MARASRPRYGGPVSVDTVSQVRHKLKTSPKGRAVAVVEGPTDVRALKKHFTASPVCGDREHANKDGTIQAVRDLAAAGFKQVVGVVDSDCDPLLPLGARNRIGTLPPGVFLTDTHDLETLALACGAGEAAVKLWRKEAGNPSLLSEYGTPIEPRLLRAVAPMGRLKYLGQAEEVKGKLVFQYGRDELSGMFDEDGLIRPRALAEAAVRRQALHGLRDGDLASGRLGARTDDGWQVLLIRYTMGARAEIPVMLRREELGAVYSEGDMLCGSFVRGRVLRQTGQNDIRLSLRTVRKPQGGVRLVGLPDGAGGAVFSDGVRLPLYGNARQSFGKRHVIAVISETAKGARATVKDTRPAEFSKLEGPYVNNKKRWSESSEPVVSSEDLVARLTDLIVAEIPEELEKLRALCRGHDVAEVVAFKLQEATAAAAAPGEQPSTLDYSRKAVESRLCVDCFTRAMFRETRLYGELAAWERGAKFSLLKH